jgi:hypothetical protein
VEASASVSIAAAAEEDKKIERGGCNIVVRCLLSPVNGAATTEMHSDVEDALPYIPHPRSAGNDMSVADR